MNYQGYGRTQGAGYQELASFAPFISETQETTAYLAQLDVDDEMETLAFRTLW